MLKVLTKESQEKVLESLPADFKESLETKYRLTVTESDRQEYPFSTFMGDLITEVTYRAENGVDGNWTDFAGDRHVTDADYEIALKVIKDCGWTEEAERW